MCCKHHKQPKHRYYSGNRFMHFFMHVSVPIYIEQSYGNWHYLASLIVYLLWVQYHCGILLEMFYCLIQEEVRWHSCILSFHSQQHIASLHLGTARNKVKMRLEHGQWWSQYWYTARAPLLGLWGLGALFWLLSRGCGQLRGGYRQALHNHPVSRNNIIIQRQRSLEECTPGCTSFAKHCEAHKWQVQRWVTVLRHETHLCAQDLGVGHDYQSFI